MTTDLPLPPITQPLTLFLLGATGDLAKKKILKAIYELFSQQLLPLPFNLIAVGRSPFTTKEYVQLAASVIKPRDIAVWEQFRDTIHYLSGDLTEVDTYERIKALHHQIKTCGNHLWYAATLPSLYIDVARFIGQTGLNETNCGWTKFLIEKPFGTDLESAEQLNQFLSTIFKEDQIYRIDHFLAKETVQNLLAFRFANGIFEHLWHRDYIDHIQVNAVETLGIAGRGAFYENTGTTRDVVQNHVLQLIAMTLMEEPKNLSAAAITQNRNQLLSQLALASQPEHAAVFGQYQAGVVDGIPVEGYLTEAALKATSSRTETAVAAKFIIENDRWQGVPLYIRAGKRLQQTATEISIQFKEPPNHMFRHNGDQPPNVLTMRIQPNEGVVLRLLAKRPGLQLMVEDVPMQFCYQNTFQMDLVEAYVKLLYDAIMGDTVLFPNKEGIELAWKVVEPLLDYKRRPDFQVYPYAAGTWGPAQFSQFIEKDGRHWLEPSEMFCAIK